MAQAIRGLFSAWEEFGSDADEYGERVLVLVRMSGRGKTSGLELEQLRTKAADVFHVHDGKVTRLVVYMDAGRALSDLGLVSETRSTSS